MHPIHQRVLEWNPIASQGGAPDGDLAGALYALLWYIDADVTVDGWTFFHVVREASDTMDVVGLMSLLPMGDVPIAISIREHVDGFEWSVQIGQLDSSWLAQSASKQWKSVYRYAMGDSSAPGWTWGPTQHGTIRSMPA